MSVMPVIVQPGYGQWDQPGFHEAVTRLLGEAPEQIMLERTHFPGSRLVQMSFRARLASGVEAPVLAELCTENSRAHRDSVISSLRKSRNGQRRGLEARGIEVDEGTGLVLRCPGLDERLPGLRLLYDADFTRAMLMHMSGGDPGPVTVKLVAHRLGKRAVLQIDADDRTFYARLRATKSTAGTDRYARHKALWAACTECRNLRIPEPLGALPELGLSLFGKLPGAAPDFRQADSMAIAQALTELQRLSLSRLPMHTGLDEASILQDWHVRCRRYRPAVASALEACLSVVTKALATTECVYRPCHRDIHEKQILMSEGVAGLLDFDTLSLADPALDAGNLLAHLYMAEMDENPLRDAMDIRGISLWRRAALLRLAMIRAFSSVSESVIDRLVEEAQCDDRD